MSGIDLSKTEFPPIYRRNGRECYLDPVRKKLIYITPEETVRQKVIGYLRSMLNVPEAMLTVEEPLSHYGVNTKDRADIIIQAATKDDNVVPLAVVECKAPSVPLDEKAFEQVLRYSDSLGCEYFLLINGDTWFSFKYDESGSDYVQIEQLPPYLEMLQGKYVEIKTPCPPPRISFERLEQELRAEFQDANENDYVGDISQHTPMNLALPLFNFWEGLLDFRTVFPSGDYGLFRLIEDYGVRMLSYGNGSGGTFYGPYRSFLVEVDGNTEFYSLCVTSYWKDGWNLKEKPPKTCICVAHDDEESAHHALQLVAEDNVKVQDNTLSFYHHGRIAVGRIGSGKKAELMDLVRERYPQIIYGDRYYLGSITSDHLLRLDEPDVITLIVNLISYSIIRDEYRQIVKDRIK